MVDAVLLDRLAALLPPPPAVAPIDWDSVEEELGTPLPADFKAFGDRWGVGGVGLSELAIDLPPDVEWMSDRLEEAMDDGLIERRPVFPEPAGLLPWGLTEFSMWTLCWQTTGEADEWTLAAEVDGSVIDLGVPFLPWLVGALAGELPREHVPDELWVEPAAPPVGARGHRWYKRGADFDPGGTSFDAVVRAVGYHDEHCTVTLDLGPVLGISREEALAAFLAWLPPELAATVDSSRASRTEEEVTLVDDAEPAPIATAAYRFASERLGRTIEDPGWEELVADWRDGPG